MPSGLMYPRLLPPSERRELADRPETDETDEAVDTDRSSGGIAPMASDGATHGSGEVDRAGGELGVVSIVVDRGGRCKAVAVVRLRMSNEIRCLRILGIYGEMWRVI